MGFKARLDSFDEAVSENQIQFQLQKLVLHNVFDEFCNCDRLNILQPLM